MKGNDSLDALLVFDTSRCEPHGNAVVGYSKGRKMYVCQQCINENKGDDVLKDKDLKMYALIINTLSLCIHDFCLSIH